MLNILVILNYKRPHMSSRFPSPATDYLEERLDIATVLNHNPLSTYHFECKSDELVDDFVPVGSILVVNKAIPPQHNHIVVAVVDGEFRLRRLRKTSGHGLLWAANKDKYYKTIRMDETVTVWGVVTGVFIKTVI